MSQQYDKVYYAEANYSQEEIDAVLHVLKHNRLSLMGGLKVNELERRISGIFNKKYGLMTNSGSSANLLAVLSLDLKKGSRVITPALTFSTTISPIVQSGLIPYFIDVERETLQIDISKLSDIPMQNVSAICVPNLVGNIANWEKIFSFAKKYDLKIIEDSADTIGYKYKTKLNNWSDITTTSFYASHVITGAGFGGMACFNNEQNYNLAISLRGWGRRSSLYGDTEDYQRRFSAKIDDIHYDDKYIFDEIAYNFLPSEISAAFALVQLDKLNENIKQRTENYNYLKASISALENIFIPSSYDNVETGWLAFPIILTNKLSNKRKQFQIFLEKLGIQTRTIFTGNILRQPVAQKFMWESYGSFDVCDEIMRSGILVGCHNRQSKDKLEYICLKVKEAHEYLS